MLNWYEEQLICEKRLFWLWKTPHGAYPIHYVEEGRGEQHVLLLHGFGGYSYTWRNQIPFLANAGYHVWALDCLGFGLSAKPSIDYSFKLFLEQIQAFMQAKQISSVHVVGNSMGGSLAVALALANPSLVRSLSLLNAAIYPGKTSYLVSLARLAGPCLYPFINESLFCKLLSQNVYDKTKLSEEQIQAYLLPHHTKGGKRAFIQMLKRFDFQTMMSLHTSLKKLQQSILVVWGEADQITPIIHFKQMLADIPAARSALIKHAAHIPHEEQPAEVNQELLSFFRSL
ncbi:hydrolase [Candidatus Protochlamydia naegleriophila]|uniref:Hydrolase n=1 Tax=Candidatus Protochlamydia naegleriophila TaxID=389348 RepID=A0A0U5K3N7_9BACT|nr:alpha/beta fold hydrolase [Candidatus Protochlamydia naegleriophila]CUI16715.1 hydrolase [Candidatus Protochlamydia naegleriophila]